VALRKEVVLAFVGDLVILVCKLLVVLLETLFVQIRHLEHAVLVEPELVVVLLVLHLPE